MQHLLGVPNRVATTRKSAEASDCYFPKCQTLLQLQHQSMMTGQPS